MKTLFADYFNRLLSAGVAVGVMASALACRADGIAYVLDSSSYSGQFGDSISGTVSMEEISSTTDTSWEDHDFDDDSTTLTITGTGSYPISSSDIVGGLVQTVDFPAGFYDSDFSFETVDTGAAGPDKTGTLKVSSPYSASPQSATITLTNPNTTMGIDIVGPSTLTEGETVQTTIVRIYREDTYNDRTVSYSVGGSAVNGLDYSANFTGTAPFSRNGSDHFDITVSTLYNIDYPETITVTLDDDPDYLVDPFNDTVTITLNPYPVGAPDNSDGTDSGSAQVYQTGPLSVVGQNISQLKDGTNSAPTNSLVASGNAFVNVQATLPYATVQNSGLFTITRNGSTNALTVNFTVTGTGAAGTNYVALPTTVQFAANQSTTNLSVTLITNTPVPQTVVLTLSPSANYFVGVGNQAVVTLQPNSSLTNSVISANGRYWRGSGSDPTFWSQVVPLDFQKGTLYSNVNGNCATLYPLTNSWSSQTAYHYNATNTLSQSTATNRIAFNNPVVAFGERVGGTPLYLSQPYNFGIYAGDPILAQTQIVIQVYARSNMGLTATVSLPLPKYSSTNSMRQYATNLFQFTTNAYGLSTTVSDSPDLTWGAASLGAYVLTHTAINSATNYYYVVSVAGYPADGTNAMAITGTNSATPSLLYSLEFATRPPWRSIFLDRPQFAGVPTPSFYEGKTVPEILTNTPPVTNTVTIAPSGATTLDASPELRRHPVLDNFVASMGNDPIALANYVINAIDLTDPMDYSDNGNVAEQSVNPGGVSRGALGTFMEKQGSPVDQCALLIYLLRQAGVPAVYQFAPRNGLQLLDARLSRLLKFQVHGAVNEAGQLYTTNTMIAVNYPWVAAYVGTNWVHIFPWLKDYEITEGYNLYEFMPTNYSSAYPWVKDYVFGNTNLTSLATGIDNTPRVIFPAYLENTLLKNHPGVSVDDIGVQVLNRQHYYARWQDFPTPTWLTNVSTSVESLASSGITNVSPTLTNIFDTVSVEVYSVKNPTNDIQTGDMRLVDLHNRQFYIHQSATNAGVVRLDLILLPFRTNITSQYAFTNDATLLSRQVLSLNLGTNENQLSVRFRYHRHRALSSAYPITPGTAFLGFSGCEEIDVERPLWKGDRAAICMDYGQVTQDMLNLHAQDLWQMQNSLRLNPSLSNSMSADVFEGATMYLAGMSYYKKVSDFNQFNQNLHKVNILSSWAVGLSKLNAGRDSFGTLTNGVDPILPNVDMFFYECASVGNGTIHPDLGEPADLAQQNYNLLAIINNSAEEHQIINRFYKQTNAVSTVRMLQVAQTKGSGVVQLNFNNYAAQGVITNQHRRLQDWDTAMWAQVANSLNNSPYTLAYMTPGPVTNSVYSGMAALILGWNQWQALISPQSLNGAFGQPLPVGTVEATNTVYYNFDNSGDFVLSMNPTGTNMAFAPTSQSAYNYSNVLAQIQNTNYVFSGFDTNWYQMLNPILGLATTGSIAQAYSGGYQAVEKNAALQPTDGLGQSGSWASDPVQTISGEFYIDETDLRLPGPMPLAVRRNYSSQNVVDNQFGTGWKLSLVPYLSVAAGNTNIYAADMDGSVLAYVRTNSSTNIWVPTLAANPRLNNNTTDGVGGLANRMRDYMVQTTNGSTTNYTLYGADGSVRVFLATNFNNGILNQSRPYLQTWTDNRGNYYTFTYGTDPTQPNFGQVIRIQCSNGNYLGFDFDINGHIRDAYSGDGRRLTYDYDEFGDLVTVTLPDATQRSYIYQHATQAIAKGTATYSTHLIIEEDKPDGRVLQNAYDGQRRVTNQLSTAGTDLNPIRTATFFYSNDFNLTNSATKGTSGYTLLTDGNNHTTRYDYANSLITKITDPLNQTVQQTWYSDTATAPGYPRSLSQTVDKRGLTNQFKYDSVGNVTNIVTIGDLTGYGTNSYATNTAVYTNGLVLRKTDAIGNSVQFIYDPVFTFLPQQVIRFAGSTAVSTNYTIYGGATNVVINGYLKQTNVAFGLPTRQIRAYGSVDAATSDYSYNGWGFVTNSIRYSGTADPNVVNWFFYNERGLVESQMDALGAYTFSEYDAFDRPIVQESFDESNNLVSWNFNYFNDNGDLIWRNGPRYNPDDYVFFDYDGAGRRTTEIHWRAQAKADGSGVEAPTGFNQYAQSFYQYDPVGNQTLAVDPRGAMSTNTYDVANQLVRRQRLDTDGATVLSSETFGYEPGGKPKYYTNALGGITTTYYTTNGLPKYRSNADGSTNSWRYDLTGRVKIEYQGNGAYWKTTYDDTNNITTRVFYSAANSPLATNIVQKDRRGNVIQRIDACQNVFTSTYDGLDRIKLSVGPAITFTNNSGSGGPPAPGGGGTTNIVQQVTGYSYDSRGLLSTTTNAFGEKTVTTHDCLGRVLSAQTYNAGGSTPIRVTTTSYSADHRSVTVTQGTGANAISSTSYTDNDGNVVLTQKSPASGQVDYAISIFDLAGNRTEADTYSSNSGQVTQWTRSQWTYDGLNRVKTEITKDSAQTTFAYNSAGDLTNRLMPGNLAWSATYSPARQLLTEWDSNGSQITRGITNTYYQSGNIYAGLVGTNKDARGVAAVYSYDDWLRRTNAAISGTRAEEKMSASWQYDPRGLVTSISQAFATNTTGPSASVQRKFDAYGQLTDETVNLGGTNFSTVSQGWDAAGRRWGLTIGTWTNGFAYRADGLMVASGGASFGYADTGLLTGRTNGYRTMTMTSRDWEGRPLQASTYAGGQGTTETWGWLGDGSPTNYTSPRSDFLDTRSFNYGVWHRRLTSETVSLGSSQTTNVYTFDGGASGKLGVITQVGPSASVAQWVGGEDAFSRVNGETTSFIHRTARGTINGAASLRGYLNSQPVDVRYDSHSAGQWTADLSLLAGSSTLSVFADRLITNNFYYTIGKTNVFTVQAGATNTVASTYDASGNITNRVWKDASGAVVKTQTLTWDAFCRLVKVTERDTNNNGFNCQMDFDALGRQLRTTETTVSNNVALSAQPSPLIIRYTYDPSVEFLFVGVNVSQGTASRQDWLSYGPDMSGRYGGMQGIGGLESITTVIPGGYSTVGVVNDTFGNVLGAVTNGVFVGETARCSLYGPMEGITPPRISLSVPLYQSLAYRTRPLTAFGTIQLGLRAYDYSRRAFLSYDSAWNNGDPNGFSAFGGNPSVYFDADGRCWAKVKTGINFAGNAGVGFLETQLPYTPDAPDSTTAYYGRKFGRNAGTAFSAWLMAQGAVDTTTGLGTMAVSAASVPVTLGADAPIAGPTFVAGGVMAAKGGIETLWGGWGMVNSMNLKPLENPAQDGNGGVDPYEVDSYKNLKDRSLPNDGLSLDHQPSNASNVERLEQELGRPLTEEEAMQVREQGTAVAVPDEWHRSQSPTYGGRNTQTQIQADAKDPLGAATRDSQAMVNGASQENKAAAQAAADEVRRRAGNGN